MTPTQWQNLGIIVTIIVGVGGLYFMRQSSLREAQRQRDAERAKAIEDAERPLRAEIAAHLATIAQLQQQRVSELAQKDQQSAAALSAQREQFREQLTAVRDTASGQLATANRTIDRRDDTIAALTARVDQLEDELRRGRGPTT